ncbi:DUF6042 family protein [Natronoglycomyces albus]|uniref:Uncharacterized protein n=1 Tax=Natronoglycomyces albus TaxID=2811108 RepID=A0A895XK43_9ACTN|nr:DUF6042 family protein [Natronoglycomyces albus]QSB05407.1 hypothetical protein JQS30_00210 [Natronoglycomyces albus]
MESFEQPGDDNVGPVRAPMHPAWIRWLPCSVELFRVVPSLDPFPTTWWDELSPEDGTRIWDEPVWCDPGDVDDWIAEAQENMPGTSREVAEKEARDEYDHTTQERSERIERFTTACRRAEVPVPHTVRQLLQFLINIELYREFTGPDGEQWLAPQLTRNPLDVLAFDQSEALEESADQRSDYEELTTIAIRNLIGDAPHSHGLSADVTLDDEQPDVSGAVNLHALAEVADVPAPVIRGMLLELAAKGDISTEDTDLETVKIDESFELSASVKLLAAYTNDELLPPEHS